MKTRVKIIKDHPGFVKGAEKNLTLNEANHLVSKGIAEIIGKVPTTHEAIKKAESVALDIEDVKKLITPEETLIEKIKEVFEESTKGILESVKANTEEIESVKQSAATKNDVEESTKGILESVKTLASQLTDAFKRLSKIENKLQKINN
jgi:hypothetical protein